MSTFDDLLNEELGPFQSGGFVIGQRVAFKKGCLNHDYIKSRAQSFKDIINSCMQPGFDLNLRIGAIKSIYPTTTQNYRGGTTESPDGVYVDVYIEYAPGLYRNPITVPVDVVEVIDDGINRGPVPDSVKRKSRIHGPQDTKAAQTNDLKSDINLKNQNVTLPGANKWDDTKPGGGNF